MARTRPWRCSTACARKSLPASSSRCACDIDTFRLGLFIVLGHGVRQWPRARRNCGMDHGTGESRRCGAAAGLLARLAVGISLALPFGIFATTPVFALSEIKREELPAPNSPNPSDDSLENTVPFPDPVQPPPTGQPIDPEKTGPSESETPQDAEQPDTEAATPIPEVIYDLERLP